MEKYEHRLACFISLRLRRRFRPDVQSKTVLILLVPEMSRELIEDIETVSGEIGKSRHRWYTCWAVCVLFSVSVPRYHLHTVNADLPIWKPRRWCLQGQGNALARQTSTLL
jgi:hypothetical protein